LNRRKNWFSFFNKTEPINESECAAGGGTSQKIFQAQDLLKGRTRGGSLGQWKKGRNIAVPNSVNVDRNKRKYKDRCCINLGGGNGWGQNDRKWSKTGIGV